MQIQVDTREHAKEWERIKRQFDRLNVHYFRSKLYVGDYMSLDNPRLVIDRKKNLLELCNNVCQQHERFTAELVRARDAGIKLIVLCEHGKGITSLEDIYFWENPRLQTSPNATKGTTLFRMLNTISKKYDVRFEFCTPGQTGGKIIELLGDGDGSTRVCKSRGTAEGSQSNS